jgi:hypothetical protein
MKVAAACLPLSNGSFLDFKTEPTHCNHIRTAEHKIDQISSGATLGIKPIPKVSRGRAFQNDKAGRGNRDRPCCDSNGL